MTWDRWDRWPSWKRLGPVGAVTSASVAAPSEGETITAGADLTVTLDIDTLPTNLLSNPGFETAGGGGADVFANWSESAGGGSVIDETSIVSSGSHSCRLTTVVSNKTYVRQTSAVSSSIFSLSSMARGDGTIGGTVKVRTVPGYATVHNAVTGVTGAAFAYVDAFFEAASGTTSVEINLESSYGSAGDNYFDDTALSEPICLDVRRTDDDNKWHLVVDTNGRPVLYERISGTDTARISGADGDHTNGDTVEIICSGDDYTLNIGGVEIGTYNGVSAQSSATIVYLKQIGSGGAVSNLTADWS